MKRVFWAVFAGTAAVYAAMILWSIPKITVSSEGESLLPFDLRPFGYDFTAAHAYLEALTADATASYLGLQHTFDMFFPALVATTVALATLLLSPVSWGFARWMLALIVLPGMVFDYCENAAVAAMLAAGASGLTPDLAIRANGFTVLKSAFNALSMAIVLVMIANHLVRRFRRNRTPTQEPS
ncbi:MAG: hypothetical protein AB7I79_02950 [Rhizobiaceae bacterium]